MRIGLPAVVLLVCLSGGSALGALTERVSLDSEGVEVLGWSFGGALSSDGRFVVFESESALVPEDRNGFTDVYVRDRVAGTTERVSLSTSGEEGNERSYPALISGDGRYVAFASRASNLVSDDTNDAWDVFVRDRERDTTERVSLSNSGQIDGHSRLVEVSGDGRCVLFITDSADVVPNDGNSKSDSFVRDRETGLTECVTLSSEGEVVGVEAQSMSADGRFVTFVSDTPGIVPEDTNALWDVFLRDREAGTTEIVSVDDDGRPLGKWCGWGAVSAGGRFVAFDAFGYDASYGYPLSPTQIYLRDRVARTTQVVPVCKGPQPTDPTQGFYGRAMSADARFIAFDSNNATLAPNDSNLRMDVFVYDREADLTTRVSVGSTGLEGNGNSSYPRLTPDGRFVVFSSEASTLVPWDTNAVPDVFVRDWQKESSFPDVPRESWAWSAVERCCDAGVVRGYDDGLYHPEGAVARDQMAVYVARAREGRYGRVPAADGGPTFADVRGDHWAYDSVEYAAENGIVAGYGDGTYRPGKGVDRAQIAVYLARGLGALAIDDDMATAPQLFPDVPAGHWAGAAIQACLDLGIVKGCRDGLYRPQAAVTRDEMAVYLARAFLPAPQ